MNKYEILKTYFGYDSFRGAQEILIDSILSGKDVLGIMPQERASLSATRSRR